MMNRLNHPYLPRRWPDRALSLALAALVPLVLLFVLAHIAWGVIVAALLFPVLPTRVCNFLVRFWSRVLLAAIGIRLEPDPGRYLPPQAQGRGALLLLNHISWVDVFVLAAVVPVRFVSKAEVRAWPLFGWLAQAVGTLFLERDRRHAVARINGAVAARLARGQSIGVFPEGTTTDGGRLLRFHSNLVQAARQAGAPVVPVALSYWQDGRPSLAAAFVGEMVLAESVLRILVAPRLAARLQFLPAIDASHAPRQQVAEQARESIRAALALPPVEQPGAAEATPALGAGNEPI